MQIPAQQRHQAGRRREGAMNEEHRRIKGAEAQRRYRLRHPERCIEQKTNWKRKNQVKHRAHRAVWKALANGKLIRPQSCAKCGKAGPVQSHHHNGYENRLDVQWLCQSCHCSVHGHTLRPGAKRSGDRRPIICCCGHGPLKHNGGCLVCGCFVFTQRQPAHRETPDGRI
jgi:hypothetical protein